LSAAVELIPERDWTAVSTRVLAERAGVTPSRPLVTSGCARGLPMWSTASAHRGLGSQPNPEAVNAVPRQLLT